MCALLWAPAPACLAPCAALPESHSQPLRGAAPSRPQRRRRLQPLYCSPPESSTSGDLSELNLVGFASSPTGFTALLAPPGTRLGQPLNSVERLRGVPPWPAVGPPGARVLALQVTDDEADGDGPRSAAALCLLQLALWPPCDLGTVLPFSALASVTGSEESVLFGVVLSAPKSSSRSSTTVDVQLWAGSEESLQSYPLTGSSAVDVQWRAVALAQRYAPLGCRLFASEGLMARALALDAVPESAMPVEDVRAEAEGAMTRTLRRALDDAASRDTEDGG
jgi:hypothetical protein